MGDVARHPRDTSKIAGICCDTVCATLCSATGVKARVWRPRSTYQRVVPRKMPPSFLHFYGANCSNTLFLNTSALTNSLLFRANSTCKVSQTPRLVEHFWVTILGAIFLEQIFCRHFAAFPNGVPLRKSHGAGVRKSGLAN